MPDNVQSGGRSTLPLVNVADGRAVVRLNRPREHNRLEAGAGADVPDPAPAPLPEPPAEEVLAVELLCPAAPLDGVGVPGNVTAPYGFAKLVPATPPVVAAV